MLRRIGWVALVAQPLVTFAIMVLVHADVDTRVMMLMAMVVGIIVVDTYLIVISYLDTNLAHQLALANLNAEELQKRASGQIGFAATPSVGGDFSRPSAPSTDELTRSPHVAASEGRLKSPPTEDANHQGGDSA